MNLSQNSKNSLFASFSASLKAAPWPSYSSKSCEAAPQEIIKNQTFGILG
jgi:hypothetical protein